MKKLIETRDLNKSFATDAGELSVLKDITFSIAESEMVSIIGASGAGKSTLLHILGALDRPTSGTVFHRDTDIFALDRNALASFRNRMVGFVFQFHHLLPEFTALENVMLPGFICRNQKSECRIQSKDIYEKAAGLLDEMGLAARKTHRPGELSGGEQQRVAVARALLLEPQVVLADEPTGNLDTTTGLELFNTFRDLNQRKGITFVIVTHNEALSQRCHRVLRMIDGRLGENT